MRIFAKCLLGSGVLVVFLTDIGATSSAWGPSFRYLKLVHGHTMEASKESPNAASREGTGVMDSVGKKGSYASRRWILFG